MVVLRFPISHSIGNTVVSIGIGISINLIASVNVVVAFINTNIIDKSFDFTVVDLVVVVIAIVFVVGIVGAGRGRASIVVPVGAAEVGPLGGREEELVVDEARELSRGLWALCGGAIEAQGHGFVLEQQVVGVRVGGSHSHFLRRHFSVFPVTKP